MFCLTNARHWASTAPDHECDFVDKIAKETFKTLNKLSPCEIRGLPGAELRMQELEKLLDLKRKSCVRVVGVLGMAGIGKTTVADCVYKRNYSRFDGYCFLANINNEERLHGLNHLQQKLLRKLLDEENLDVGAPEGAHEALKDRLQNKRLFIVLDDVTNEDQIRILIGQWKQELYREGSRIVITTRDKKLLEKVVDATYVVPRLSDREALELFCLNAFSCNLSPTTEFMDLSNKFVDYAKGHPLALKLLGSDLSQRDKLYWQRKLERLEKRPDGKIQEVLKMSYMELCPEQKSIFLDIACFFKSEKTDFVSRILNTDHIDATTLIDDLVDKCLVTIYDNRLEMHDLLLTMGKEISYESSIKEAGNQGRLWNQDDICRLLKYKTGTAETRGIFLDMSNLENMKLSPDVFTKMWNLKFLKFYNSHCSQWCENDSKFCFPCGLDCFPDDLVYLHWQGYPLEYLPSNFNPKKLVDLNLRHSHLKKLWEEEKNTAELRWLDISHSKDLLSLSGLLDARNIERLNAECCTSLIKCSSIRQMDNSLRYLAVLNLKKCCKLRHLPSNLCKMKSLQELILSGCSKLKCFPEIDEDMEHLEILLMDDTAIKQIPIKMCMSNLKMFTFGGSKFQGSTGYELLPFSGCSRLSDLYLTDCNLHKLPNNFSCLSSVHSLCLSRNNLEYLPESIKILHHLKSLDLKHCRKLNSLPVLPSNLQYLDAHDCASLETIANPMTHLVVAERFQSTFIFTDCFKLNREAQENIVAHAQLKSQILANACLKRNHKGLVLEPLASVSFPGSDLPLWFRNQRMGSSIETHLPPHWCDSKFMGISLCVVVSFKDYEDQTSRFSVICKCKFKSESGDCIRFVCTLGGWNELCGSSGHQSRKLGSDHVFLSYNNCFHVKKFCEDGNDYNRCCITAASFKFFVNDDSKRKLGSCEVVKCGMSLLYAPDESDYRLQETLENNLEEVTSINEADRHENGLDEAVLLKRRNFFLKDEEHMVAYQGWIQTKVTHVSHCNNSKG
ncbi:unnamed protein product [Arabidopsis arenosa]|uniref:ADP-ribosyl cyclase/cyclic ADP-ribose hydrolase n=1 Tax=Arabidopsis arenosa TaxID=38785 RepID=A0A8S2B1R2_ARAAE|nr:unnamed protein product [Arabidopsis arenosa]